MRYMHTHRHARRRILRGGAALVLSAARMPTAVAQAAAGAGVTDSAGAAGRTAVEVAALRSVADDRVARADLHLDRVDGVVFDRRVGRSTAGDGDGDRPVWPAAYARQLAGLLGAPVVDGDRLPGHGGDATCRGLAPGGPALVSLGAAVVRGDSAFAQVTTRLPPGARGGGCYFARLELVLRRMGGRWRVVPHAGWLVRS